VPHPRDAVVGATLPRPSFNIPQIVWRRQLWLNAAAKYHWTLVGAPLIIDWCGRSFEGAWPPAANRLAASESKAEL